MMTPQEGAKLVTALVTSMLLVALSNADVRAESSLGEDAIRCSIHAPAGIAATALTDPKRAFAMGSPQAATESSWPTCVETSLARALF